MPFFSIIVPVYKVEKYLSRFLESVASQTFTDYEVLLVDDGSPDHSGAICDEFCTSHPLFRTIHKPNGGVSSARNLGIEEAKGEWLLFFDSDDVVIPEALEKIHRACGKYDPDVVIYNIEEDTNGMRNKTIKHNIAYGYEYKGEELVKSVFPLLCTGSTLNSPCNKAYRHSIITENMLSFPNRKRGEDWLFNLRYFECISSAVAIDYTLYYYMRNEDSAMTKYLPEQYNLWVENRTIRRHFMLRHNISIDLKEYNASYIIGALWYFVKSIDNKVRKDIIVQQIRHVEFASACKASNSITPIAFEVCRKLVVSNSYQLVYLLLVVISYILKIKK